LGTGVRIESGTPINDLRAHPVYQNGGEIPIGGRGALGRTATLGEGDIHAEYMVKLSEKHSLHFGADLFNVANQKTQLRVDQLHGASLGTPNFDFKHPRGNGNIGVPPAFQRPFNARLNVKWCSESSVVGLGRANAPSRFSLDIELFNETESEPFLTCIV
jgi:hypothetical protein